MKKTRGLRRTHQWRNNHAAVKHVIIKHIKYSIALLYRLNHQNKVRCHNFLSEP
jgi:hypothetical protein